MGQEDRDNGAVAMKTSLEKGGGVISLVFPIDIKGGKEEVKKKEKKRRDWM